MALLKQTDLVWPSPAEILANSASIKSDDLLTISAWFASKTGATDTPHAIAKEDKTVADDNQTALQVRIENVSLTPRTTFFMNVSGWTITQASVGTLFNITADQDIDGSAAWTRYKCVEYIHSTYWVFSIV